MTKTLVMDAKVRKNPVKRYSHYDKNARKMHRRHCSDPGWCNYQDPENPALADDINLPWPERQQRAKTRLVDMRHCQAAVEAENASAEIERHLAAIRKIKRRGRPLKSKESFRVYPT